MAGRVELSKSTWQQPWPPRATSDREAVLHQVGERVEALRLRRVRVAIDGRTAAGKTTLGHELATRLSEVGRDVFRASLDDFKRPWSERHNYDRTSGEGYYRNAFDLYAVRTLLLEPSATDGSGRVALCSIDPLTQIDHSSSRVEMPDDSVLIVDGVFAFRAELRDFWDLRIWIDSDADTSIRRGIRRDAGEEGVDRAEALHRDRYEAAENIYIAEVDPVSRADVIIDNSNFDAP
ncbi:MAG TPA: hypothetical protein VIX84_02030, partial [Acidimicrobiales bacterium]